ncbi:uncharacterized protein LOC132198380 isoform X2 [Neocloeon triangulifer]|uniref:uncharacterized protein LOC132198380 isoform X2 n=1 Tax=Neocloeon triangulifer TaxID=2078957 RepID=UPI00286EC7E7|nr:uncharacterized protein LOC132198380 isoform X2 [Neocloeon triangulifer]
MLFERLLKIKTPSWFSALTLSRAVDQKTRDTMAGLTGNEMPTEVISYIMDFLPLGDRISASMTCRQWYEASKSRHLHTNEVVFIHSSRAIKDLCPEAVIHPETFEVDPFSEPPPFQNFCFREVEVKTTGEMRHFWPRFGPNVRSLSLQNCEISEKAFNDILFLCPRLRHLHISGCNELYMSGKVLEGHDSLRMAHLTELELTNTRYISDSIFNRFISVAPNLQTVVLLGCNITCSSAVYGRFYPESKKLLMNSCFADGQFPLDVATNVFTFENVLNVLAVRKVTSLGLGVTSLAFDNLNALCEKLDSVRVMNLRNCFQLVKGVEIIANSFSQSLQDVDMSECCFVSNEDMKHLGRLTQLRRLNLNGCKNLENSTVLELKNLQNLNYLNVSNIEKITGPAILEAVTGMKKLKHLFLNRLALLDSDSLLKILKQAPPLITLELACCMVPLIDAAVAVICNQHTTIKRLNLSNCPFVSDVGLTGLTDVPDYDFPAYSPTMLDASQASGFSLGSKAERQIVFEAKRKMEIAEQMTPFKKMMQQEGQNILGISKLKSLSSLDLSNCSRVTDLSIRNVFKFNQLKYLNLERNCQITDASLQLLVMYCPSLEELNIQECGKVTDLGINYLSHLHRLREINVTGCDLLTDASLEALMKSKSPLRAVSLQRCSKFTVNAVNIFCNWLNHSINWSEESEREHSSTWYVPPPPPPNLPFNGHSSC